jgi:hypothetical protein
MFYAGFAAGVGASCLIAWAVAYWYNRQIARSTPESGGSVPFMRRKPEIRKPRVNDDRKAFEAEVKQAKRD